ncbi:ATP-dependent helicase, partial [Streptomyces griseus]|nr:ATP-dependent helicase [Streptomyces griseus]
AAGVAEPVAEPKAVKPRRRTRIVKPADEVDFQIAPAAEPEPEVKTRRRPARATTKATSEPKAAATTAEPKARATRTTKSRAKAETAETATTTA